MNNTVFFITSLWKWHVITTAVCCWPNRPILVSWKETTQGHEYQEVSIGSHLVSWIPYPSSSPPLTRICVEILRFPNFLSFVGFFCYNFINMHKDFQLLVNWWLCWKNLLVGRRKNLGRGQILPLLSHRTSVLWGRLFRPVITEILAGFPVLLPQPNFFLWSLMPEIPPVETHTFSKSFFFFFFWSHASTLIRTL